MLISLLRLPDSFTTSASGLPVLKGNISWKLTKLVGIRTLELPSEKTVEQVGVHDGDTLALVYEENITFRGGFMKSIGVSLEYETRLGSGLWYDDEMGSDLISASGWGSSELLDKYIENHLRRFATQGVGSKEAGKRGRGGSRHEGI